MNGAKRKEIFINLIIAGSYYLFWALATIASAWNHPDMIGSSLLNYLWQFTFLSSFNLLLYIVIIPSFRLQETNWKTVALISVPVFILLVIGFFYWNILGGRLGVLPDWKRTELSTEFIVPTAIQVVFGIVFHGTLYFLITAIRLQLKNYQLAVEKKNSELNYLKSQTNPHFLFNTLNNIYSLARDRSELTADSVLRLSNILRYMLYGAESDRVPVDNEVKIIKEYIELEKMRYESLQVTFTASIDDPRKEMPPLLLIHLVENAFKHGVSETIASPYINIQLTIREDLLVFSVGNSSDDGAIADNIRENIGLANLRRQLQLLFREQQLRFERKADSFFAELTIDLNSYEKDQVHYN